MMDMLPEEKTNNETMMDMLPEEKTDNETVLDMLPQTARAGQHKAVSKLMVKFTVFIKTKSNS